MMAALVADLGDLSVAEDAAQDALERALERWPVDGIPDRPGAWVTTVARRQAIDRLRRDKRGREKHELAGRLAERLDRSAEDGMDPDDRNAELRDEQLQLVFGCCHPALRVEAQIALTLRSIGGLTTSEIARAFLVPEPTMAQRLVRAKKKIATAGIPFAIPADPELLDRLAVVHRVLYLIFNEGYQSSEGDTVVRADLTGEAIRLTRLLAGLVADDPETLALLALMLLTEARRPSRVDQNGDLVLLEDQDRSGWDRSLIAEGRALIGRAVRRQRPGPFQIEAAIAEQHAIAVDPADTRWDRIEQLYGRLHAMTPTPVVALNHSVARAMADGPGAGLQAMDDYGLGDQLADYRWYWSARADLLRRAGNTPAAADAYRRSVALTSQPAELRFLEGRLAEIDAPAG